MQALFSTLQVFLLLRCEYNFRIRFHFGRKEALGKFKCKKTVRRRKSLKSHHYTENQYRIFVAKK